MNGMQRIIGKHALIIAAKGQTELAAQVFVYDQLREVRVDMEKFEVRILMSYDKDYFRVYKIDVNEHMTAEKARELVLNFYNNLLNAAMKLSPKEIENLKEQRKQQFEQVAQNLKADTNESEDEVVVAEDAFVDTEEGKNE